MELTTLLADGGATPYATLTQSQADIIGRQVLWSSAANASGLGTAYLAGLAMGVWQSLDELAGLPPRERFAHRWPTLSARATLGTMSNG